MGECGWAVCWINPSELYPSLSESLALPFARLTVLRKAVARYVHLWVQGWTVVQIDPLQAEGALEDLYFRTGVPFGDGVCVLEADS